MRPSPFRCRVTSVLVAAVLGGCLFAPEISSAQGVDNTAQNKGSQATADNQSNAKADRMMTAQIRRAIIKDKSLSLDGHNVKIIVQNGTVTLKGPVASEQEKEKILQDAASVTSSDKIADQLTVK